jgi:hypothetical protein
MGVVLLGATVGWMAWGPRPTPLAGNGEPAAWRIDVDTLSVYAADGRHLWNYRFPFEIESNGHKTMEAYDAFRMAIGDLDADRHREVVFLTSPRDRRKADWRFYCFSNTGVLRWTHSLSPPPHTFGNRRMDPAMAGDRFFLTPADNGHTRVWLTYVNGPWFPSVLIGVDELGRTTSEFWSAGYITTARPATWEGRPVLLVGARNNESHGASVALLDGAHPTGSAPANTAEFRCTTCPAGAPLAFVVLPQPGFLRGVGGSSPVMRIEAANPEAITVWVCHFLDLIEPYPGINSADVIYTLDRRLRPIAVAVGDHFNAACEQLARLGRVSSCPTEEQLEELGSVRWWNGTGFEDLTVPLARTAAAPTARSTR